MIKDTEKSFFIKCWNARFDIEKLHDITFHCSKQEHYYMKKWSHKGMWNYGVSVRGGWFEIEYKDKLPKEYKEVLKNE